MRRAAARASDDGFTLIEVVVSLVLLGIVASAALAFFIEGTQTTSHLQRTQNAVAVANEAMEQSYGINPQDKVATTVPGLVVGRTKADVDAAFAAASGLGVTGVADMYPLWDTSPTPPAPALPVRRTTTHSGEEYTVTTLVGSCFRSKSTVSTDQPCRRITGVAADPGDAGTPASLVRMLRVVVMVTWRPVGGECGGGTCMYQLAGLVDRSQDLEWNQVVEPVAVEDVETFMVNEPPRDIDLLANDLIGPLGAAPVQLMSTPGAGTLTAPNSAGVVRYTVPPNASGRYTFTYRLKDARGAQSDVTTVTLTIPPQSAPDAGFRVLAEDPTVLNVLANDLGTKQSVQILSQPAKGAVAVSGTTVTYTSAAGATGGDSFTYAYTDATGLQSPPATVSLAIDAIVAPSRFVQLPVRTQSQDAWADLTPQLVDGNADVTGWKINVSGSAPGSGVGTLQVGGTTYGGQGRSVGVTANAVRFNPARNWTGEYSFTYSLTNAAGTTSKPQTAVIRIDPVAPATPVVANDAYGPRNFTRGGTYTINILANDTPNALPTTSPYELQLQPLSCDPKGGSVTASASELASGQVRITLPGTYSNSSRACTFTYRIVGKAPWGTVQSQPATVVVQWNN